MKIHLIKTHLVNSIVVEYPERILVMDVAIRCHREVVHFIEVELKRSIDEVELVICSHDDPDHIGGIKALAAIAQADMATPYASNSAFKKFINDPTGSLVRVATSIREAMRGRSWKMYLNPKRNQAAKQLRDKQRIEQQQRHGQYNPQHGADNGLQDSQNMTTHSLKHQQSLPGFSDWQVIHTPGHSWDSCCFFHRDSGALISGDTLLGAGSIDRLVKPAIYANSAHFKRTISRLRKLPISAVYPGHGSVIRGDDLLGHF